MEKPRSFCKIILVLAVLLSPTICQLRTHQIPEGEIKESGCYCIESYEPVCGNNGVTYPNSCFLTCDRKQNPSILGVCHGECPCCKEAFYNEPVDGQSGWGWKVPERWWTPSNDQEEQKDNLGKYSQHGEKTLRFGSIAGRDGCICTDQYDPVCGSDGKTYGNACALKCAMETYSSLTQKCKGECPCSKPTKK